MYLQEMVMEEDVHIMQMKIGMMRCIKFLVNIMMMNIKKILNLFLMFYIPKLMK